MPARLCLLLLIATTALAQMGGIAERLRQALDPSGRAEAGVHAFETGNLAEVERLLSESAAQNPSARPDLLALEGAIAFLRGDMTASAARFREASRVRPLNDSDSFTLAMAEVRLGNDDRARSLLSGLSRKQPDRALYLYWLGRLDYNQRRYPEAVQKLTRATELEPASARIWDSLGLAFDMQGQNDQALRSLQKAAALNRAQPHPSPWPPHDLGSLLLRTDKPQEAESALRESLRYDPGFAQAHYHLGRTLDKESRNADAIEEYSAAASEDKTAPEPCYSLAMLYRKLGRDREAEAMFAEYRSRKKAQPLPDLNNRPAGEDPMGRPVFGVTGERPQGTAEFPRP
jgi:tetratricopeptide (TPR) repeat protein